jgi:uncharacterized membrane protein YdbT with pleckstrin-like domain
MNESAFYMDEGEELLLKVRKHIFLVSQDFLGIGLFALAPYLTLAFAPTLFSTLNASAVLLILSTWTLLSIIGFATVWTDYYLDLWVVTDKRIVVMEQYSLFNREVTTMRMERIQDTTIEFPGFWATFFNFGNLTVHTAGEHTKSQTFEGIPDPEKVKSIVIERIDCVTEHKSKLEYTNEENPTHSV